MEITITKRRLAVNWWMLALAVAIVINLIVEMVLMIVLGAEPEFVAGLSLSFIGIFLFGVNYVILGTHVVYYKKYKTSMKVKELTRIHSGQQELSSTFVTEEGKLLE